MPSFGELLRNARVSAALSQATVAEKIGVAQPTISTWETNTARPSCAQLDALRGIFPGFDSQHDDPTVAEAEQFSVGGFGEWLRQTREEKCLTVGELAENAKVTQATIYNLETGRSRRPQAATKERLERALGANLPSEIQEQVELQSNIAGLGGLIDFDPYSAEQIPALPGVYVLYDVSERPIYVGKGNPISTRINDHKTRFWFQRPIVANAAYVQIEDAGLRHQVEQVLIKFLKKNAVINRQSVDRSE